MRVADYIFNTLADYGVRHVFMVTGGGAMYLDDAIGKQKRIKYVCNHHEQSCAIAAEGYSRVTGQIGVVCVTSGPGGTNTITGVTGAWLDSIPMLVISGQVKLETTILQSPKLRQLGDQEINITDIVRPITKYAVIVRDKLNVKYHLQKALYLAKLGRPGPVWIDIPLDIQGADINEIDLREFKPEEIAPSFSEKRATEQIEILASRIKQSQRPVILVGNGIILSGARDDFSKMVDKLNIPVLTAISGVDLIPSDSPMFFGRPGILGERCANFILQNSDLFISIGTRVNLRLTGYSFDTFAREAFKVFVDIDEYELQRPTLKPDLGIHSDAKYFLHALDKELTKENIISVRRDNWVDYCRTVKKKYPVVTLEHRDIKNYVSSYYFAEVLSKHLRNDAIIVTGNGTAYTSTYQAIKIKQGQRMFANLACASMGYGLPASIGASFARNKCEVICITGDGSIQMNLQELQTILNYELPIKIFMFNNKGYLSIKLTQKAFFDGSFVGSTYETGVKLPDMIKLAKAYGYQTERISNHKELEDKMPVILDSEGPVFCEVMLDPFEKLGPKVASEKKNDGRIVSKPLEDLFPFLPREEFHANMIIKPLDV